MWENTDQKKLRIWALFIQCRNRNIECEIASIDHEFIELILCLFVLTHTRKQFLMIPVNRRNAVIKRLRKKCPCRTRSFSGPYFPAFGLNTERYAVNAVNTQKMRNRKTPNMDTFYAEETVRKKSIADWVVSNFIMVTPLCEKKSPYWLISTFWEIQGGCFCRHWLFLRLFSFKICSPGHPFKILRFEKQNSGFDYVLLSCHIRLYSESRLCNHLNVKKLLGWNRRDTRIPLQPVKFWISLK